MEYYFFVIIVVVVLKVLFWTCYFYLRAQRLRHCQAPQRVIIVGTHRAVQPRQVVPAGYNDRSAIIHHAEPVSATGPPPYAEVVKDGGGIPLACPPSYDQATSQAFPPTSYPVAGGNTTMTGPPPSNAQQHYAGYPGNYGQQQFAGQQVSVPRPSNVQSAYNNLPAPQQ